MTWTVALGAACPSYARDASPRPPSTPSTIGAIIPFQGEITDVMVETVRSRIEEARKSGAKIIILDMDTPGGAVSSSIAIADLIKEITDVKTVAWVHPNAHSGGALVAVACEEIVMARSSRLGDAQVVVGGPQGVDAVPESLQPKAYSPVIAEFRASARLRGYDEVLSEAFVVPEREIWWLENVKTGQREFVVREEKIRRIPDEESRSASPGDAPEPEWRLVETYFDPVLNREVVLRQPIDREDQLLEMSAGEAFAYGFCKAIISDEEELTRRYGLTSLQRFSWTWSESLAYWLTSTYVRAFLLVIIMLAIYVEFHTPGVGLAGLVALIGLVIFVGAPYLTGLANAWEILLIVVGLGLIALEIFVIPGFGLPGVAGILLVIAGLLMTFVPEEPGHVLPLYFPTLESARDAFKLGVIVTGSSLAVSLVGMMLLGRYLPRIPLFQALIPANPLPSEVQVDDPYHGAARVGDRGEVISVLRPAGKARFGSLLVDVVTQGEYLEPGVQVEVVERRGNRVVVRERNPFA